MEAIVWNKIYEKLNAKPIPKCNHITPLVFFEEREAPNNVRKNDANDMEMR